MKRPMQEFNVKGFSLVEMMVAMAIGLFILVAVSTVLVNSKKNYTQQDSLARLQENARFAMQFIIQELRMAGYFGCADDLSKVTSQLKSAVPPAFNVKVPIEGSEAGGNWQPSGAALDITPKAGTDAVRIRFADAANSVPLTKEMPQQSASMQVGKGSGLQEGEIVMLSDCSNADIFQITNMNDAAGTFDLVVHNSGGSEYPGNDPANNPQKLSKVYGTDAQIMKFASVAYFIGLNSRNEPALFRQSLATSNASPPCPGGATPCSVPVAQEIVEGIEALQITYGVDNSGDRVPDRYYTAATVPNWGSVTAVRIGILASSLANTTTGDDSKQFGTDVSAATYSVNGTDVAVGSNQRREYRVFVSTVVPRNLQ